LLSTTNIQTSRPNFTLTLLRTPDLSPKFASFHVPLNLNKLDLRDYLWNCYGVSVISVRSYIQLQKMRQDKPGAPRPKQRRWFRPRSIKKMTVEMERPFVWPEVPDLEKWDKTMFDAAQAEKSEQQHSFMPISRQMPTKERASIAQQAKSLLRGQDKWTTGNTSPEWENVGVEREVETDVQLPQIER
jgi:large subunit ribosomal protein L23